MSHLQTCSRAGREGPWANAEAVWLDHDPGAPRQVTLDADRVDRQRPIHAGLGQGVR